MKTIIKLLIIIFIFGCTSTPYEPVPQVKTDPCKYRTEPSYDQTCLNSAPGKWELDVRSQAMVNKEYKKFCWPNGTEQVPYDCDEDKMTPERFSGRWKFNFTSQTSQCYPFTATTDITKYGNGIIEGLDRKLDIQIDKYGNVSSGIWERFTGTCNDYYCTGTFKYKKTTKVCAGIWKATRGY